MQERRSSHLISRVATVAIVSILASSVSSGAHAAGPEDAPPPQGRGDEAPAERRFGVETSLVFPLVHIYFLRGSYAAWEHGKVLAGFALQLWDEGDFGDAFAPGQAEAYTLLLGYRQYLWKGLHVEVELFPAYNRFHSTVDNRVHAGLELWMEGYAGYELRFELGGVGWFVTPQVGVGFGVAKQKKWPGEREGDRGWTFVPNLLVGAEF